jgi:hypothetical protein
VPNNNGSGASATEGGTNANGNNGSGNNGNNGNGAGNRHDWPRTEFRSPDSSAG